MRFRRLAAVGLAIGLLAGCTDSDKSETVTEDVRREPPAAAEAPPVAAAPVNPLLAPDLLQPKVLEDYEITLIRERLQKNFICKCTVNEAFVNGRAKRLLRLFGQTQLFDVLLDGASGVHVVQQTALEDNCTYGKAAWGRQLTAGDVLTFVKQTDGLGIFLNGETVMTVHLSPDEWNRLMWCRDKASGILGGIGDRDMPLTFQKTGIVNFRDDFMHGEGVLGDWTSVSGTWNVHAENNPVRSANPFSFVGRGEAAEATAGHWFWRNYRLRCALLPLEGAGFGLRFYRSENGNYYEVSCRQQEGGQPVMTLSRKAGTDTTELAVAKLPQMPSTWMELWVQVAEGTISAGFDGRTLLTAVDPKPLLGGSVSLLNYGGGGTVFDDVEVTSVNRLNLQWQELLPQGDWKGVPMLEMPDSVCHCDLNVTRGQAGTLEYGARSDGVNEIRFVVSQAKNGDMKAVMKRCGVLQNEILTETEFSAGVGERHQAVMKLRGNNVWLEWDGRTVLFFNGVDWQRSGQMRLRTMDTGLTVTSVAVEPLVPMEPVTRRVEMFSHEISMRDWNDPVLEWKASAPSQPVHYWHRSDFWSDVSASLEVNGAGQQPLGVALQFLEGGRETGLAILQYHSDTHKLMFNYKGEGEKAEEVVLPSVGTVCLQREGDRLQALVDGELYWLVPLAQEAMGLTAVGRIGKGNSKEWASRLTICARGTQAYSFSEAPSDWLVTAGTWDVTNRWQCDPRWSFYSGANADGVACNWCKLCHGDNVTVECHVGPKMDRARGKNENVYAGEFNFTLAADGKDLDSGYSFLYGGNGTDFSQIYRKGELMVENQNVKVPRKKDLHHTWFHLKIRKEGKRLSYWVDNALVGTVTDEHPLTGDRLAMWTWKNGMMVACMRVSSDSSVWKRALPMQSAVPRTIYDK